MADGRNRRLRAGVFTFGRPSPVLAAAPGVPATVSMFSHPAWREKPLQTAYRWLTCMVRRRVGPQAVIGYDGGRSRMQVDVRTAFGYTLYRYGHQEADIDLVRQLLAPGDVFVDGGAHVGLYTLAAAARVGPGGKVLAFEPAGETRRALETNVRLSGFTWVHVFPQALAEGPGRREFTAFPVHAWGSSSFAPPETLSAGHTERVETAALDAVVPEADWPRLKLVKLDLEGAEWAALQGARRILREARPDFLVEAEPEHLQRQGASVEALVRLFSSLGYRLFRSGWDADGKLLLSEATHFGGERPNLYATPDLSRAERAGIRSK